MTKEELLKLIEKNVTQQGNEGAIGLTPILNEIVSKLTALEGKKLVEKFDATEMYYAARKRAPYGEGKVTPEFAAALIEAVDNDKYITMFGQEPSGFKFKVVVGFAGMDENVINFNAADSKAHYKMVLDRKTLAVTFEQILIKQA